MGHSLKGDVDLMHYNAQSEEDLKRMYDKVMEENKTISNISHLLMLLVRHLLLIIHIINIISLLMKNLIMVILIQSLTIVN